MLDLREKMIVDFIFLELLSENDIQYPIAPLMKRKHQTVTIWK